MLKRLCAGLAAFALVSVSAMSARAAHPLVLNWTAAPATSGYEYTFQLTATNSCFAGTVNLVVFNDRASSPGLSPDAEQLINPTVVGSNPAAFTQYTTSSGFHNGPTFYSPGGGWVVTGSGGESLTWKIHADNLISAKGMYWSYLSGPSTAASFERAINGTCAGPDADGDGIPDVCDGDKNNDCTAEALSCNMTSETTCDGADDNCNGSVDEGFGLGTTCTVGVGACRNTGVLVCSSGGTACSVTAGTPSPEQCNEIDDDCDGTTDEDFDLGAECSAGVGACTATGTKICSTDHTTTVCNAVTGTPGTELCGDGVDNDCDGTTDEGFDVDAACTVGVGACVSSGAKVCSTDRLTTICSAIAGEPSTELCGDAIDNDCDGTTDEGFDVGAACSVGVGACSASGTKVCSMDKTATVCNATPATAGTESCNGVDDDCDGTVDNGGDALCMGKSDGTTCITAMSSTFCGCNADNACGGATSGRICDASTKKCVEGCAVGMDRNGCPAGTFCTTTTAGVTGVCTTTCNFDADCTASVPSKPYCLKSAGDAGTSDADVGADAGAPSICVECATDAHCASRTDSKVKCVGANNTCAQCSSTDSSACMASGDGSACLSSGLCGCSSDADCATDRMCNTTSSKCDARPAPVDAGTDADVDAGDAGDAGSAPAAPMSGDGCGCRTTTRSPSSGGFFALLGLIALRARRRSR